MNDVPKIIHQVQGVYDGIHLSKLFTTLSQSWKDCHPLWQYKLWSLQDILELIQKNFCPIASSYKNDINDKQLLDIARYFILYQEGGIFVDLDFECIGSFDDIIKGKQCCISYDPQIPNNNILSGSLMMSRKGHPFLKFIISRLNVNFNCLSDERKLFLNKTYDLYDDRESIDILPHSIINPCSSAEIKLHVFGLISDAVMEDFLSEALSICYYQKEKTGYSNIIEENKNTDVLYLSSSVGYGGAFRAAHRIHSGLRSLGVNSRMLVLNSSLGEKGSLSDNIHLAIPEPHETTGYHNDLKYLENYPRYSIPSHSFTPGMAGMDISRYINLFNPKIVQIHWINAGYLRIEDLGKIKKKIVWRLADCWPLTGGCYYFGDCQKYMDGCGKCPKLGSEGENDLSREVWQRKEKAWKEMDMVIVVPTPWMKEIVENSTLLKNRKVFVIPNGLDLDEFYPVNKRMARTALNIPPDKKVILYGATNAINDPRKGFSLLLQALRDLPDKYRNEYHLVIFGAEYQNIGLEIPVKFMGYVRDHYILQALYSAADVMVVPSLEEAFGQTVTEAMACMTPVISFRETGPAGIIEHGKTGYLAEYGNADDLGAGIKWILEDNSRLEQLSANARRGIETTYDIRIIAKQYQDLYEQILSDTDLTNVEYCIGSGP